MASPGDGLLINRPAGACGFRLDRRGAAARPAWRVPRPPGHVSPVSRIPVLPTRRNCPGTSRSGEEASVPRHRVIARPSSGLAVRRGRSGRHGRVLGLLGAVALGTVLLGALLPGRAMPTQRTAALAA